MATNNQLNTAWLVQLTNPHHDGTTQQIDDQVQAFVTDNAVFNQKRTALHQARQTEDETTGETVVATAKMLTAANGRSRLGATVHTKFSQLFAQSVSWQKVDAKTGAVVEDEDITDNGETPGGGSGSGGGSGTGSGSGGGSDEGGGGFESGS